MKLTGVNYVLPKLLGGGWRVMPFSPMAAPAGSSTGEPAIWVCLELRGFLNHGIFLRKSQANQKALSPYLLALSLIILEARSRLHVYYF